MTVDHSAEILRLRATVRDLLALSTIGEAWVGREPPAIAAELADVLIESLQLDFAFVRLCAPTGSQAVEVMRGDSWKAFPEWLQQRITVFGHISRNEIVTKVSGGEESCRGIVIPIGVNGERGLVAAACDRSDFPDQIDQQLLSVAANNAATAFQNACLINELRSVQKALRDNEQELRKARDELEMKVAERTSELQRSEAYLAEAQRLTHTGSWAGNVLTREMLHSSEEHARLYGFDPDRGPPSFEALHQRIHPEDRARVDETFESASRAVTDIDVHYRIVLPDGTTRYVQAVGHPVFKPSGDLGEFVGFLMDVTESKRAERAEEALRQAQAELAHVARLTTLGELTASIAHEINQPLTAVVTNGAACLRWLQRDRPDLDEACATVQRVVTEGQRAGAIITRIRALAQNAPAHTDWLDLNATIHDVLALARSEVHRHGVVVETHLAADVPRIRGDRIQLQQVLLNLLMNAIEALSGVGDGPREVVVRSDPDAASGVLVAVCDSGPGLDPQRLDRLFEAFYTTKPQGLGLGLAISRRIIEAHGGRLWATANVPHGAVLQFTVPRGSEEGG